MKLFSLALSGALNLVTFVGTAPLVSERFPASDKNTTQASIPSDLGLEAASFYAETFHGMGLWLGEAKVAGGAVLGLEPVSELPPMSLEEFHLRTLYLAAKALNIDIGYESLRDDLVLRHTVSQRVMDSYELLERSEDFQAIQVEFTSGAISQSLPLYKAFHAVLSTLTTDSGLRLNNRGVVYASRGF
jgi:hypothetical protein